MKNKMLSIKDELTDFLLYTTPDGKVKVEIIFHNDNIWLNQKRMAELFNVNIPAISKHLNNIYESGELEKEGTYYRNTFIPTRLVIYQNSRRVDFSWIGQNYLPCRNIMKSCKTAINSLQQ